MEPLFVAFRRVHNAANRIVRQWSFAPTSASICVKEEMLLSVLNRKCGFELILLAKPSSASVLRCFSSKSCFLKIVLSYEVAYRYSGNRHDIVKNQPDDSELIVVQMYHHTMVCIAAWEEQVVVQ